MTFLRSLAMSDLPTEPTPDPVPNPKPQPIPEPPFDPDPRQIINP